MPAETSTRRLAARAVLAIVGLVAAVACGGAGGTADPPPNAPSSAGTSVPIAAPGTTLVGVKASAGCHASAPPGSVPAGATRTLATATGPRSYRVTAPANYDAATPTPLVLLFHGFGSNPDDFSSLTRLPEQASAAGSIVVVPEGANKTWQTDGHGTDAAFVDALIDDLATTWCVDEHRISAAGFSAGAAFTIAFACAHPERIAAITTVAVDFKLGCTKPLPILAFHGTADPLVPYQDGAIGLSLPGVKVRGTELNVGDWAAVNGCDPTLEVTSISSEVTRHVATNCDAGTEVILYEIVGGGHTWPGADPSRAIGLTTQQVDATQQAITFFGRHHLS